MKIEILDFTCNESDTILVKPEFVEKYYNDDVEEFLISWCGYSTSQCQWMVDNQSNEAKGRVLTLADFSGDDELDISEEEVEANSIYCCKTSIDDVMREYADDNISMEEVLGYMSADGLSVKEAFELYIQAMERAESNKLDKAIELTRKTYQLN